MYQQGAPIEIYVKNNNKNNRHIYTCVCIHTDN